LTSAGVGVLENEARHVVVPTTLKLLEVVVVVETHAALSCKLPDLIEGLRAAPDESAITGGEELDLAPDLGVAELRLIVERLRQDVAVERIDVAPHDRQSEVRKVRTEFVCLDSETNPAVVAGVVVRCFQSCEACLRHARERAPGICRKRLADGVELESDTDVHWVPPCGR
jgi:hypothetical protein